MSDFRVEIKDGRYLFFFADYFIGDVSVVSAERWAKEQVRNQYRGVYYDEHLDQSVELFHDSGSFSPVILRRFDDWARWEANHRAGEFASRYIKIFYWNEGKEPPAGIQEYLTGGIRAVFMDALKKFEDIKK